MKKLIINALLIIILIIIIIALIWGLSKLRAGCETEQELQKNTTQQTEQMAEHKEVVEQTQVKVNGEKTTKNTTNTSKTAPKPVTTDKDVSDFFDEI